MIFFSYVLEKYSLPALILLMMFSAQPAIADYDRAVDFYNRGEYSVAFKEFLPLAKQGDMDAQQAVGLMYERGRGVRQDYAEAARWYEKAALQGHEIAAGNLGVLYRDGLGVKKDYKAAIRWLKQGAMADDPYAMHNLGALYANGQGTSNDMVEGWAWVSLAVEEEDIPAATKDLAAIGEKMAAGDLKRAKSRAAELRKRIDNGETDSGYRGPAASAPAKKVSASSRPAENNSSANSVERWASWEKDGFSLRYPAAWKISTNGKGAVGVAGPQGQSLIIWPMFTKGKISNAFASNLVGSMTRKLEPGSQLSKARVVMPRAARADGTWSGRDFIATVAWQTTSAGDAGTYVLASAPQGSLDKCIVDYDKIMKSLSLRGIGNSSSFGGSSPARKVAYTSFTDPTESAFTVDVPVGWQVKGGIARFNASDVRPWLRTVSNDGRITVFMGEPQIPTMLIPNQPLAMMGYTEGMVWDAGYNQRFLLKSYYPGKETARLYVQEFLSNQCGDAVVEDFRDRPDVSATINRIFRQYQSPYASQELHTGEIARSCQSGGRAQYVFAGTLLSQMPTYQGTFGMWVVNYLYGFDAPREEAATALEITRRMADSFRVTPHWAQMNGDLQGNVSNTVAATGAAIAKTVSDGYWGAQRSREKGLQKYGEAILGVEETVDPLTGRKIDIVSGHNYGWVDNKGNVVGTQTHTSPGIDYRELFKVNR